MIFQFVPLILFRENSNMSESISFEKVESQLSGSKPYSLYLVNILPKICIQYNLCNEL